MKTISLFGINFSNVSMEEVLEKFRSPQAKMLTVTPNLDHLAVLQKNLDFQEAYNKSSLILADGWPLIMASKLLRKPIKEKVSGSDLFIKMLPILSENKNTIYIVGPSAEINNALKEKLQLEFPQICVVGMDSPPFGFEKTDYSKILISKINKTIPDFLFFFLGSPKSEVFLSKNFNSLHFKVALPLGASIRFYTGHEKRAPIWMQTHGLEWFWRMVHNPKRLVKRYLFDFVSFIPIFMKEVFRKNR